ncbi:MAG: hypothetical protein KKI12_08370 [Proteobacteria bacterium]|nr:hypothetical protein [Pseudomonadota bacterium]MBU4259038.1 hypothetical protein [Pseudomonadota bacterium]MBU4288169.1 hypothetical protein [Pseudomonadota bacterium]MBU4415372.1 hypothetical protein [Pseudomonadota bacterium]MCG2757006.1 hypothetical protein [Desulfobacteraceae bacterium]
MIDLTKISDPYERRARIYPGLICLFPIIITVFIVSPKIFHLWSSLAALAVSFGLLQLLAHIARDRGKYLEVMLLKEWGGMPSIRFLRFRDQTIPKPAKKRYHAILSEQTGIDLPSKELENDKPAEADEIYQSWSDYLRGKTRNSNKYPLVFKENVNYGFRRNIFGLRLLCLLAGIFCLVAIIAKGFQLYRTSATIDAPIAGTGVIVALYLCIFIFIINKQWVKLPADAYARQLLEALNA